MMTRRMEFLSPLRAVLPAVAIVGAFAASGDVTAQAPASGTACVDYSSDPAGCQPSTFDTPFARMPSVRVNRKGEVDPFSSEEDAKAGAFALEKQLHLFRNFEHLHWVVTVPSTKDPATGAWRGGDLDGAGDGRGLGIAGNCIFVGHANGAGVQSRDQHLQNPAGPGASSRPCRSARFRRMSEGNQGFDDRELRALVYRTSKGEERYLLVRNAGTNTIGRMETYRIDPTRACRSPRAQTHEFHAQSHEFFLWHDPKNANRVVVYVTNWTGGVPDPDRPGQTVPDLLALAITDENTGEMLDKREFLAGFTLQDVGGPPIDERPDATGLFSDGRFADFSDVKTATGQAGNLQRSSRTALHSISVTDDGERVYVAGTTAGFYVLDSEAVAQRRDAELAAGTAGCTSARPIVRQRRHGCPGWPRSRTTAFTWSSTTIRG